MYDMSQHHYYHPAPAPPRQYAAHGTSSAFSSSANPDEDWTKISDLAERRRIQNRIAQRNYRKKLKRRLEDLERRAGPAEDTPEASASRQGQSSKTTKKSPSKPRSSATAHRAPQASQFTPPMQHDDDALFSSTYDDRDRSISPPYVPSSYPSQQDDMIMAPFAPQYHAMTTAEGYASYMAPVPCTLPSMSHFSDALKRETYGDESLSPYMNYGYMSSPYDQPNPHTPPMSFDHSAACSDAGYEYPATPLSMPDSPHATQH